MVAEKSSCNQGFEDVYCSLIVKGLDRVCVCM